MYQRGFIVLFLLILLSNPEYSSAQKSEIGISFTLSGHLIFGPYFRCWMDDHNELDICIPAAWEGKGKVLFPNGFQTGYHYYFGEKHWRPSVGLQYHLYFGPKENEKRKYLQLLSLVPGIQYRWNESKTCIEELLWISTMKVKGKQKIFPTGLETKFGVKL
jgi:hypothetical protein